MRVYARLKSLQGDIIPKFIFCGSDFNFLFVFVTTYEGESLKDDDDGVAKEKVDETFVFKARDAIICLHQQGVIHGDVAKRNILQRKDGKAIWIDFELSKLKEDFENEEEFKQACEEEVEKFDALFNLIQSKKT